MALVQHAQGRVLRWLAAKLTGMYIMLPLAQIVDEVRMREDEARVMVLAMVSRVALHCVDGC